MAANAGYVGTVVDTTNATQYTFSNVAIGAASADRIVIVSASGGRAAGGTHTVSSLTIAGSAAVLLKEVACGHLGTESISLWALAVPTGTTANIVVTWNASMIDCGIGVWALTGAKSTVYATASDNTTGAGKPATTISCLAGGSIIAAAGMHSISDVCAWTGLTERFDEATESANGDFHSGASDNFAAAQTNRSIIAEPLSQVRGGLVVTAWSPSAGAIISKLALLGVG